jgi:Kef-type K+ transport system membrane component KefB
MSSVPLLAAEASPGVDALRRLPVDDLLLPVIIQLAVIIAVARLFALLFRRIGQPSVVGEIVAGLVLGPSLLQWVAPALWRAVFQPALGDVPPDLTAAVMPRVFSVISELGLIFLLFLVGLEFDLDHLRSNRSSTVAISLGGIGLLFPLGLGLASQMYPHMEPHPESGENVDQLGFMLFLGVAMSITAIPVLSRIMFELNITRTRLGTVTIGAAAMDDVTGWVMLGTVAGVVKAHFDPRATVVMILYTAGFVVVMFVAVRPFLVRWARRVTRRGDGQLNVNDLTVLLVLMFGCAIVTNAIGMFSVFGPLVLGVALSDQHEFRDAAHRRLRDMVTSLFLPVFFTATGLRTDLASLGSTHLWGLCGLVLLASVAGKMFGCGLAARACGFTRRESALIGAMMNTRGLMALIVVDLGYQLRVIPPSVFTILVIMALATTFLTTPLVRWLAPGTELEEYIHKSDFGRPAPLPDEPVGLLDEPEEDPADPPAGEHSLTP